MTDETFTRGIACLFVAIGALVILRSNKWAADVMRAHRWIVRRELREDSNNRLARIYRIVGLTGGAFFFVVGSLIVIGVLRLGN